MRDLLAREATDPRGEAVDLFCYQTAKYLAAYAAVLGGLDILVFTGRDRGARSAGAGACLCPAGLPRPDSIANATSAMSASSRARRA